MNRPLLSQLIPYHQVSTQSLWMLVTYVFRGGSEGGGEPLGLSKRLVHIATPM